MGICNCRTRGLVIIAATIAVAVAAQMLGAGIVKVIKFETSTAALAVGASLELRVRWLILAPLFVSASYGILCLLGRRGGKAREKGQTCT